jgi:hypothetical protein
MNKYFKILAAVCLFFCSISLFAQSSTNSIIDITANEITNQNVITDISTNSAASTNSSIVAFGKTEKYNASAQDLIIFLDGALNLCTNLIENVNFGGVYTIFRDGEYGGGFGVQLALFKFVIKDNWEWDIGPADTLVFLHDQGTRSSFEIAISTKVIEGTSFQKNFDKIWVVGKLPIDVSELRFFLGLGCQVDDINNYCGSAGLSGIKWGKGSDKTKKSVTPKEEKV